MLPFPAAEASERTLEVVSSGNKSLDQMLALIKSCEKTVGSQDPKNVLHISIFFLYSNLALVE